MLPMPAGAVRTPNPGTGLLGECFARRNRRNRRDSTDDRSGHGRWFAVDEAGTDGDQLYVGGDRHLVLGGVAVDDVHAAEILRDLRSQARRSQRC